MIRYVHLTLYGVEDKRVTFVRETDGPRKQHRRTFREPTGDSLYRLSRVLSRCLLSGTRQAHVELYGNGWTYYDGMVDMIEADEKGSQDEAV